MKKLFIAALLFVGVASFAQDADQKPQREQRERLTTEERSEKQLKRLTSELSLDAKQQDQIKQLIAERNKKADKLKETRKGQKENVAKLTADQKEAFKKQITAEKEANDAKMKGILTADQYKKWTTMQEENRDKTKRKMKGHRKEKN